MVPVHPHVLKPPYRIQSDCKRVQQGDFFTVWRLVLRRVLDAAFLKEVKRVKKEMNREGGPSRCLLHHQTICPLIPGVQCRPQRCKMGGGDGE